MLKALQGRVYRAPSISSDENVERITIGLAQYQFQKDENGFVRDLITKMINMKGDICRIEINLDGSRGYSPSFIRQTVKKLAMIKAFPKRVVGIDFISRDEPSLPNEMRNLMYLYKR